MGGARWHGDPTDRDDIDFVILANRMLTQRNTAGNMNITPEFRQSLHDQHVFNILYPKNSEPRRRSIAAIHIQADRMENAVNCAWYESDMFGNYLQDINRDRKLLRSLGFLGMGPDPRSARDILPLPGGKHDSNKPKVVPEKQANCGDTAVSRKTNFFVGHPLVPSKSYYLTTIAPAIKVIPYNQEFIDDMRALYRHFGYVAPLNNATLKRFKSGYSSPQVGSVSSAFRHTATVYAKAAGLPL